jgi:hypothetical protein
MERTLHELNMRPLSAAAELVCVIFVLRYGKLEIAVAACRFVCLFVYVQ